MTGPDSERHWKRAINKDETALYSDNGLLYSSS